MELFDSIERREFKPAKYSDGIYSYLNLSAREEIVRIRKAIQEFFDNYPNGDDKLRIFQSFRSKDDHVHHSAFFEIFIHALFSKAGYKLKTHPEIEGMETRPDFSVFKNGKLLFYIEATISTPSKDDFKKQKIIDDLFDKLNKIKSPNFWFQVHYSGYLESYIKLKDIEKPIMHKLNRCSIDKYYEFYKSENFNLLPNICFNSNSFKLEIIFVPKTEAQKKDNNFRNVAMISGGAYRIITEDEINKSIRKKAKKYNLLNHPLIIAVNCIDDKIINADDDDVSSALFGKHQVNFHMKDHKVEDTSLSRDNKGAFFHRQSPINSRINAVLIGANITSFNFVNKYLKLWHNPYSYTSQLVDLIPIPQMIPNYEVSAMEFRDGISIENILKSNL
ncbi:MAG: hypothetical protein GY839_06290 [candidate division Zixibacteria bacterium]|nr:hypothetical protein [candidate division Zixibacteria bacterium]